MRFRRLWLVVGLVLAGLLSTSAVLAQAQTCMNLTTGVTWTCGSGRAAIIIQQPPVAPYVAPAAPYTAPVAPYVAPVAPAPYVAPVPAAPYVAPPAVIPYGSAPGYVP